MASQRLLRVVMCCFSGTLERVAATRIFARPTYDDHQIVVYEMEFEAKEALAMILPLPVKAGINLKEFHFVSLAAYPKFFEDMNMGFPPPPSAPGDPFVERFGATRNSVLEVVSVGNFVASYVPGLSDFDRLDRRFRINPNVWRSLPGYDGVGFAVFKLKPGNQKVHPMCFSFPRRNRSRLFFPTLHIHDGAFHPREKFDHILYAQGNNVQQPETVGWEESSGWASQFMNTKVTEAILHHGAHVYRRRLQGELPNEDTLVALS